VYGVDGGGMKRQQVWAIKAAIKAMDDKIQDLAVDANLHDIINADYPAAVNASRERKKLEKYRIVLEEMIDNA